MRLLSITNEGEFKLTSFEHNDAPPYAILSHTWTNDQEVTYDELNAGTGKGKLGYTKLRFCGDKAVQDGLQYFWVDTCCINKNSSAELSESINSMFRWYQHSTKCYVSLSDVQVPAHAGDGQVSESTWKVSFRSSRWFRRGWTLQELLAPSSVEFFSKEGVKLGDKISLAEVIHDTTQIPTAAIRGCSLGTFDVDERMKWIANRQTTRQEDIAYCLLGIFGVFMTLIYGEGEEHAFSRLKEEIAKRHDFVYAKGERSETKYHVSSADHPDTLKSMAHLAAMYKHQGRNRKAEDLGREVLELRKRELGPAHQDTLKSMAHMASIYRRESRWREARELGMEVLETRIRVLGPEHQDTLKSMTHMAATYRHEGRWKDAIEVGTQILDIRMRVLGPEHRDTLRSMGNLAAVFKDQGKMKEARELEMSVFEIRRRVLGPGHPDTLKSLAELNAR